MVRPNSSVAAVLCCGLLLALPVTHGFVARPLAPPQQQACRTTLQAHEGDSASSLSRQGFLGGLLSAATGTWVGDGVRDRPGEGEWWLCFLCSVRLTLFASSFHALT